jgi:SNF2 family DNA or RNA helicase
MCVYGETKWCLTGTPIRNGSMDIYSQFRFIGFDKITNQAAFKDEFNKRKLHSYIYYKNYEDCEVKLPECTYKTIKVPLEGKQKEIYDYYLDATRNSFQGFTAGGVHFANVLVLFMRLRQVCIAPYIVQEESKRKPSKRKVQENYSYCQEVIDGMTNGLVTWLADKEGTAGKQSAKIKTAVKLVKTVIPRKEKIIIFSTFKSVIDILAEVLEDEICVKLDGDVKGKLRESVIERFLRGNARILLASYKVGSEGLNLVEANNVIFTENWWTPTVMDQAARRVYRMGQANNVNIWQLVADISGSMSIEDRIEDICIRKRQASEEFIEGSGKMKTKSAMTANEMCDILRE